MKNKKAQIDSEVITGTGFWILLVIAVSATLIGYVSSKKAGWIAMPLWQLLIMLVVEVVACYIFAARMFN